MSNKAVLLSVQPKWCELIATGKKTIEIRKTKPKIKVPFKAYIYCTKDRNNHFWTGKRYSYTDEHSHNAFDKDGNGKVIGEFVCNKIATFPDECYAGWLVKHSCVSVKELERYAGDNDSLYVWHISNLVIYDEPKELSRFLAPCDEDCASCKYWQYDMVNQYERDYDCTNGYYPLVPLKKGPQSWRYTTTTTSRQSICRLRRLKYSIRSFRR